MPGVAEQQIFTSVHVFLYLSFFCIHIFISFNVNYYTKQPCGWWLLSRTARGQTVGQGSCPRHYCRPMGHRLASCSCDKHHGFPQVAFEWCQWLGIEKLASRTRKRANEAPCCRNCDALWASTCEETRPREGSALGDQS